MASHCILLRHGTPVPEEQDPERPLSEQGHGEADSTASAITAYLKSAASERRVLIAHSGKLRARQTAEAVMKALLADGWEAVCEEKPGLSPNDEPAAALELIEGLPLVKVVVGHLPHVGKLAATMVKSPAAAGRLGGLFHPAGGLVLRRDSDGAAWVEAVEVACGESWWIKVVG
ncbi:unnamed protein product [Symbiodinium pilosum]|uniref:Phosphohistidine phosphatase SixA n=1 Tax=Symbiodinium pilosum TaxID=2952 RepID=A0A812NHN1_SYMPI|nr:unnamed protein product [Symbiodinium pilosum]